MSQSLISSIDPQAKTFEIDGDEAFHLIRVLRKKVGDQINLFDGRAQQYLGEISFLDPQTLLIRGSLVNTNLPQIKKHQVRLFQGIPRGSKFDYVIEKAGELGVHAIVPFLSEKNLIKLTREQKIAKQKRWQNLAKAAAKQSEQSSIPLIGSVIELGEIPRLLGSHPALVLNKDGELNLKECLERLKVEEGLINILVGPESGLTRGEMEFLKRIGGLAVSLGKRVLRSETAGLVALSIINYELNLF